MSNFWPFSAAVTPDGVAAVTTWPLGHEAYTVIIYQAPPDRRRTVVQPFCGCCLWARPVSSR